MDRQLTKDSEVLNLIRRSELSRNQLSSSAATLRHQLDVPLRLKKSLRKNPTKWLAGSLASGMAFSLLFRRRSPKPKPQKKRGYTFKLLALTLTAARPLAKIWLSGKLNQWATQAYSQSQSSPFTIEPSPTHVQPPGPRPR